MAKITAKHGQEEQPVTFSGAHEVPEARDLPIWSDWITFDEPLQSGEVLVTVHENKDED